MLKFHSRKNPKWICRKQNKWRWSLHISSRQLKEKYTNVIMNMLHSNDIAMPLHWLQLEPSRTNGTMIAVTSMTRKFNEKQTLVFEISIPQRFDKWISSYHATDEVFEFLPQRGVKQLVLVQSVVNSLCAIAVSDHPKKKWAWRIEGGIPSGHITNC